MQHLGLTDDKLYQYMRSACVPLHCVHSSNSFSYLAHFSTMGLKDVFMHFMRSKPAHFILTHVQHYLDHICGFQTTNFKRFIERLTMKN